MALTIAKGVKIDLPGPEKPPNSDVTDVKIWRVEMKDFMREKK